jgi:hypothetical protein
MTIPCAARMRADVWSPIAPSCNPTPGIGRNAPHVVVQAREKQAIQHVAKAGAAARIGAIVRKWPGFPAKPDNGHHFFMMVSCSVTSNAGSPPKPANALGGGFPPAGSSRPTTPAETKPIRGTNVLPALNAPTKALKNARIRRPFKGNGPSLAADVRGRKHHNLPL